MLCRQIYDAVSSCIADYIANIDGETEVAGLYEIIIRETESVLIKKALDYNDYNQTRAAKWLGITRNTLKKKIIEFNLNNTQK